jgi:hypothetical protein
VPASPSSSSPQCFFPLAGQDAEGGRPDALALRHLFIVSRFPETFRQVGSMLLGWPIRRVEEILVGKPVEGHVIQEKDLYNPEMKTDVQELLKG